MPGANAPRMPDDVVVKTRSDLPEGFLPSARRPRKTQHQERTPRAVYVLEWGGMARRLAVLNRTLRLVSVTTN